MPKGIGHSTSMARRIEAATGVETRATILGYMQRGGSPYLQGSVLRFHHGLPCGGYTLRRKTNRVVGYRHGEFKDFDIEEALAMQKDIPEYEYKISKLLAV